MLDFIKIKKIAMLKVKRDKVPYISEKIFKQLIPTKDLYLE